jgi:putative ATP-binding cassette transporter
MTDPAPDQAGVPEDTEREAVDTGLRKQLRSMRQAVFGSAVGKRVIVLVVLLLTVILVTAYGQVLLNHWNKPFYDAISRRDLHDFLVQLGVFFIIAGSLLVLNVFQRWLVETTKYKLREGLTTDLLNNWMLPRRAFWLANAGAMGVNPDQRMHEDTRKLCDLSADLGVGLLQASILFATFAGVLWVMSNDFTFRFGNVDYAVPGFMLWAAIIYAALGSLLSYWVGRSLIKRNEERYAREADLRFALVRINEHLDGISLASGEADEKRRVEQHLVNVLKATRRLVSGHTNLTWVTAGFGWITNVGPTLVAAPLYFTGKISFGGLMMAAAAFTQAQSSLRWFVDNFPVIADWRATLFRVASFRQALVTADVQRDFESRITYEEGEAGVLVIDDLEIVSSTGWEVLKERKVTVRAGERVLICGQPGTNKTTLFRALAGLWPWGSGRIVHPRDEQIIFMPRGTPYLPRGTLREVLAYPLTVDKFGSAAYMHALTRLGLERLAPALDETKRWDRDLTADEQLALALARIVLQQPPWVLMDDVFSALDDEGLEHVTDLFAHELAKTSLILIGKAAQAHHPVFTRVLHLIKAPAKVTAMRDKTVTAAKEQTAKESTIGSR